MTSRRATAVRDLEPIDLGSEMVFRRLVDAVEDYAIFMLDPRGYIRSWNPGAERIKGYKAAEIIGHHFSKFYPKAELDAGKPELELRTALEAGHYQDEGWRVRKDGSRFWASVVITAVRDEDGRLMGYGKITRDLTDRRRAEQRYRLLIEGVTDYAIFSLDAEGCVTSWNSGAERIKQYSANEIIGQSFSRFYTPEDRAAGLPQKVLATARSEGHYEGEGWRVRKDGTRFWASVVVTAMFDDEGQLSGYSKVTRDITERKQLLDQVHRHAQELEIQVREREATNAELESFSYSVSHDLRAPLRAIEGFATALQEDYGTVLDATASDYLNRISSAALRMNRLVQDLLDYSRLSRIELPSEPVLISSAVDNALGQLDSPEHVQVRVPEGMKVMAHRSTLVQMLYNLISNGLKFHPEGAEPSVEITAEQRGSKVRISVCDNGIGIDPAHHQRIFQVFERLHGADAYPGTGIGLAIVKRGTERMGGAVGLESEPGKGSKFWLELAKA
ncbi:MAG TPA: PAS domain S-box protein [Terriglobales bacterium]|nr:PAS domain S-box protein [Terriglobales bacterium]